MTQLDSSHHCNADFKRQVVRACCDALAAEGYTRFRVDHVDWPFKMGFHGWVGLNTALYSDYVEINPFVGIHSIEIERLWTSLKGSIKKTRYDRAVSTYAVHFSAILPQINSFKFYSASDITVKAEELAKLYAIDGIEFSKSLSSYEVLRDRLYERVPLLGAYPERYACCLLLLEQKAQASEFVASFVKKNPNYFPNFDQVFGKFIEGNIMREFVG